MLCFIRFCRFLILHTHQIHRVRIASDSNILVVDGSTFCLNLFDILFTPETDGSSGSDRNPSELEPKPKQKPILPRKEPPPKLRPSPPVTAPATQNVGF